MAQKAKLTDVAGSGRNRQLEAGRKVAELAREVDVRIHTIYAWKAKFGGMEPSDVTRLRHLEDENSRLKNWLPTSVSTRTC